MEGRIKWSYRRPRRRKTALSLMRCLTGAAAALTFVAACAQPAYAAYLRQPASTAPQLGTCTSPSPSSSAIEHSPKHKRQGSAPPPLASSSINSESLSNTAAISVQSQRTSLANSTSAAGSASATRVTATTTVTKTASATASLSTSTSVPSTYQLPEAFDSTLGTNFTSTACPSFFQTFLADPSFHECAPFSLLLGTSAAFFDAQKNPFSLVPYVLNASCTADVSTCSALMSNLATRIRLPNTCGEDLKRQNPLVVQALQGFQNYGLMREAGCQLDGMTGRYCFAEACASATPDLLYFYYLAEGTSLPSGTSTDCDSCTQGLMNIYSRYAVNSSLAISDTYSGARSLTVLDCGPTFAPVVASSTSTSGGPATLARRTASLHFFEFLALASAISFSSIMLLRGYAMDTNFQAVRMMLALKQFAPVLVLCDMRDQAESAAPSEAATARVAPPLPPRRAPSPLLPPPPRRLVYPPPSSSRTTSAATSDDESDAQNSKDETWKAWSKRKGSAWGNKAVVKGVSWSDKLGGRFNGWAEYYTGSERFWPVTGDFPEEMAKCARILRAFTVDGIEQTVKAQSVKDGKKRQVKVIRKIPASVLQDCKGVAIFTSMRSGIAPLGGAGGAGVICAKLDDGSWSAPSAMSPNNLSVGAMLGVDIYDAVLVIRSEEALETFKSWKVTLGAEFAVAAGPYGAGAAVEAGKDKSPVFSYIRSRGVYAGVEAVAQVFITRTEENENMYHWPGISPREILEGMTKIPREAEDLMDALEDAESGRAQRLKGPEFETEELFPLDDPAVLQLQEGEVLRLPPTPNQLSEEEEQELRMQAKAERDAVRYDRA
ncbi:hypothetical protein OIV83_006266 [Microbotryomycetes sp. JL201]|nr:hypothetical protein OIV83_006266 [Microbotryomycetes sp. JL201]